VKTCSPVKVKIRSKVASIALVASTLAALLVTVAVIHNDIIPPDPTEASDPRVDEELHLSDTELLNIVSVVRSHKITLLGADPLLGITPHEPSSSSHPHGGEWIAVYTGKEGRRGRVYYLREEAGDWIVVNSRKIVF